MNEIPDKWYGKGSIIPLEIAEVVRSKTLQNANGLTREELIAELKEKYHDLNDDNFKQNRGISFAIIEAEYKCGLVYTFDKNGRIRSNLKNPGKIMCLRFNKEKDITKQIIEW